MKMILVLILMMSSPAFARDKYTSLDGRPMMRETYAAVWKAEFESMWAKARKPVPKIKLIHNILYIFSPDCDEPDVKTALAETIGPVKKKLKDIDMRVECVSNTVTVAANP